MRNTKEPFDKFNSPSWPLFVQFRPGLADLYWFQDFKIHCRLLTNHDTLIVGVSDIYHGPALINSLLWAALWMLTFLWQAINTPLLFPARLPPPPSPISYSFMEDTSGEFNWIIDWLHLSHRCSEREGQWWAEVIASFIVILFIPSFLQRKFFTEYINY